MTIMTTTRKPATPLPSDCQWLNAEQQAYIEEMQRKAETGEQFAEICRVEQQFLNQNVAYAAALLRELGEVQS